MSTGEARHLIAPSALAFDWFGQTVVAGGPFIFVGQPGYGSSGAGRVLIVKPDSLNILTVINPPLLGTGHSFGSALVADYAEIVVGSPDDRTSDGAVSLHSLDGQSSWSRTLTDLGFGDLDWRLGFSVAMNAAFVAVGAPLADGGNETDRGVVFILDRASGELLQMVEPGDGYAGAKFGSSLAMDEDYLVVGAPGYRTGRGIVAVYSIQDLVPISGVEVEAHQVAGAIHVTLTFQDPSNWVQVTLLRGSSIERSAVVKSYSVPEKRSSLELTDLPWDFDDSYWLELVGRAGEVEWFGPINMSSPRPASQALHIRIHSQPRSNYFKIYLQGPSGAAASLSVFDLAGRLLQTVWTGELSGEELQLEWHPISVKGRLLSAGVYFLRCNTGASSITRKVVFAE